MVGYTRPNYEKLAESTRLEILVKYNYICQYCEEEATDVEHIKPRSHGGSNYKTNLVASCRSCNSIAKDLLFLYFEDKKEYILKRKRESRKCMNIMYCKNSKTCWLSTSSPKACWEG